MSLSSMTGFARVTGAGDGVSWTWEIRSVNGRGLDMRCRLPAGFEHLEPDIRAQLAKRFQRGAFQIALQAKSDEASQAIIVNRAALDHVVGLVDELRGRIKDAPPPRVETLLSLKGVLETQDAATTPERQKVRDAAILASFERALDALGEMRASEGAALKTALETILDDVSALAASARDSEALRAGARRKRLEDQLAELVALSPPVEPARLAQELALYAAKADIREELDRLDAHVDAARELLSASGPSGRRLDFLSQEFNREANTLCAKASDVALSNIGIELKAQIDRFREQVQNIE